MILAARDRLKPINPPRLIHRDSQAPLYWWIADRTGRFIEVSDSRISIPNIGGVSASAGDRGPVVSFNGTSGYCQASITINPTPISVLVRLNNAAWANRCGLVAGFTASGSVREWGFEGNANILQWNGAGGSTRVSTTAVPANGVPATIVATDTGGTTSGSALLYLNGSKLATGSGSGTAPAGSNAIAFGTEVFGGGHFFTGWIDEVRVYNYVLTPGQVAAETFDPWWRLRRRRSFGPQIAAAAFGGYPSTFVLGGPQRSRSRSAPIIMRMAPIGPTTIPEPTVALPPASKRRLATAVRVLSPKAPPVARRSAAVALAPQPKRPTVRAIRLSSRFVAAMAAGSKKIPWHLFFGRTE